MDNQDFTCRFTVRQNPEQVADAISDVRRWWTGDIEGGATQVGDTFTYRYATAHYSKQEVAELVPGARIVWNVVDSHLEGYPDPSEWNGSAIVFDLTAHERGTEFHFSHRGLTRQLPCFDNCSSAWNFFIKGSLQRLITTGEGPTASPWA